jgi:hypothetical protein
MIKPSLARHLLLKFGGGNTAVVGWENQITVSEDYTMTTGNNMVSAGPITIDTGFTVTVPTGSRWVVV